MVGSIFAWKHTRNEIQLGKAPNHKFSKHVPLNNNNNNNNNNNIYYRLKSARRTATAAALSLEKDVILGVVEKWKSLVAHGIEPQSPGR
jgi:hypothetical protein